MQSGLTVKLSNSFGPVGLHSLFRVTVIFLAIKRAAIPYMTVASEIEQLPEDVEGATAASSLPEVPGLTVVEDLVTRAYARKVGESI